MKNSFMAGVIIFFLLPIIVFGQKSEKAEFYVAQWNIENLFDTIDEPGKDDSEFLTESEKFWTEGKVEQKLTNLAKVINYMNNGTGPEILAVEEVENFNLLKRLIYKLKDRDYLAAHRESPDLRGIDVGLLFDRTVFDIVDLTAIKVNLPNGVPTRDILHVTLKYKRINEDVHFFVNHWPSRRGGKEKSSINRETAAKTLKASVDSILDKSPDANIIMLGDFNDGPADVSITRYLNAGNFDCSSTNTKTSFLNLSYKKAEMKEGSYLYGGKWDMIDQIILSAGLKDGKGIEYKCDSFDVIKPSFMVIQSGNRKGGALPTYMGKLYTGGYSDHFPVGAKFYVK